MATEGCFNFSISCVKKTDSADDGVINWLELCGACTGLSFSRIFVVLSAGSTSSRPAGVSDSKLTITMNAVNFQALLDCLDSHPTDAVLRICYRQTGTVIVVYSVSCGSNSLVLTQLFQTVQSLNAEVGELRKIVRDQIAPAVIKGERSLDSLLEIASQLRR